MTDAYIVSALRTPVGRKKGSLASMHPADLGAIPLKETFNRVSLDPALVEDVIYGCVDTVGPQAGDIARTCWLVAGLPDCVPGTTVDRQCGSSQQAVHFAAQAIMSGYCYCRRCTEHEYDSNFLCNDCRSTVRIRKSFS